MNERLGRSCLPSLSDLTFRESLNEIFELQHLIVPEVCELDAPSSHLYRDRGCDGAYFNIGDRFKGEHHGIEALFVQENVEFGAAV